MIASGIIYAIVGVLGAILIGIGVQKPKRLTDSETDTQTDEPAPIISKKEDISVCAIKFWARLDFWHYYLLTILVTFPISVVDYTYKDYGFNKFDDDDFVTNAGSTGMLMSGFVKFFWGFGYDIIGFKRQVMLICFFACIGFLGLTFMTERIPWAISLGISLVCEGGMIVTLLTFPAQYFGVTLGTKMLPILNTNAIISITLTAVANTTVIQLIGFPKTYSIFMTGITFVGLILVVTFKEKSRWWGEGALVKDSMTGTISSDADLKFSLVPEGESRQKQFHIMNIYNLQYDIIP
eukprot:TRINITY_DN8811_c0_g4_i1.p1 TRINITY_DN8811_c0_g4~~TRINITY_DN8811_c0_g4_i1.p1  ORF type:complete len:294 (+),score=89.64 TRINITY_DN8811_c0_g4_i1:352-1233(+)